MLDFDVAWKRLIDFERGWVNNKSDPGGPTKYGISQKAYPKLDIKLLSLADAKDIYLKDYWMPISVLHLPNSITYQVFDFSVNSGIDTAIKYLQRAIGVTDDGKFGSNSYKALGNYSEIFIISKYLFGRLNYLASLENWKIDSGGWTRRVIANFNYALSDTRD